MHARSTHPMLLAVTHRNRKASPCSYTLCACASWPRYSATDCPTVAQPSYKPRPSRLYANPDLTQPRDWYAGDPLLVDYGNWRVSL